MKSIILFLFFIQISLFFCNFVLPFKYQYPEKNNDEFLFNYFHNDLIIDTYIGSNSQFLPLQIKFRSYYTYVISNNYSNYSIIYTPNSSNSSKKKSDSFNGEEEFGYASIYSDNFVIKNEKILDFDFICSERLSIYKHLKSSGVFGFNLALNNNYEVNNLIVQLKKKNLISDYYFSLIYSNDNNGKITIGKKFDENKYKQKGQSANAFEENSFEKGWNIKMTNITLDYKNKKIEISNNKNTFFYPEFMGIIADYKYMSTIEKEFFSKYKKCQKKTFHLEGFAKPEDNPFEPEEEYSTYGDMNYFICDQDEFNPKNFPKISFYSTSLNFTFTFNYEDLFIKNENHYYHLIVSPVDELNYYIIGKPIFKNYLLEFNYDKKIMNVYEANNSKANKFYLLYIFLIIIILFIICYIIYFKFIYRKKKKQASELIEDYNSSFLDQTPNKLGIN